MLQYFLFDDRVLRAAALAASSGCPPVCHAALLLRQTAVLPAVNLDVKFGNAKPIK